MTGYRGATLLTNPPPSSGGLLIAFALKLLERQTGNRTAVDSVAGLSHLAEVMREAGFTAYHFKDGLRTLRRWLDSQDEALRAALSPVLLD